MLAKESEELWLYQIALLLGLTVRISSYVVVLTKQFLRYSILIFILK